MKNLPIGITVISKAMNATTDMLFSYLSPINRSFLEKDELSISISLKFKPHKNGVSTAYQIAFIESKVKDGDFIVTDEKKHELPFEKAANDFVNSLEDGDSVEIIGGPKLVKKNGKMEA